MKQYFTEEFITICWMHASRQKVKNHNRK